MRAGWPERRLGVDRNNALLLLSNFFWGLGSGLYTAIWPVHLARLGAAPAQIGLALSITTAVSVVVYIPAAALAGRLGRKRTMLLGWSMGPASALVFALATTWEQLLPGIVLLALVALCSPAYLGYIATAARGRDLPRLYAMMTAAVSGAAVLSSPLGGHLAEVAPMSWLFAGVGLAYVLSVLVVAALDDLETPRPGRPAARPPARPGPAAQRGALRAYGALLSERRLMILLAAQLALVGCANLAQPLAANWLVLTYGYSLGDIGLLGAATAAAAVFWGLILGRIASRRGAFPAQVLGAVLVAGGAVSLLGAASLAFGLLAYVLRGAFAPLQSLASGMVAAILLPPPPPPRAPAPVAGEPPAPAPPPGGRAAGAGRLERGFALYNTMLNLTLSLSTLLAGALFGLDPALPFAAAAGGVLAVPLVIRAAAPAARALRQVGRSRRATPA